MTPKFGLFTPYTLRFHTENHKESSSNFLKRSLVLFDQMTYISPRQQDLGFLENIILNDSPKIATEIMTFFRPINNFVSEDFMNEISFSVNPESNMCYGPNREEFIIFIKNFLTKNFGFDAYNIKTKEEFEILDYYVSAVSADFNFLFQVSKKNKDISALYTELHRDAYTATYQGNSVSAERVLQKVCSINYFDFGKLSWEQIFELKKSDFLNDFRTKFNEWLIEYSELKDEQLFENKINKYIRTSNFAFLTKNKPKLGKSLTTGVLGNIPLPIPNPISIYTSIEQINKDVKNRKDFGWLFFIQEAFNQFTKN
ncbi:hypothetical protein [Dokdonia sp. Asnod3-C12]|uniref:hypothetical protein n=1 Tax=Dokdonia sp. Asnod3-C12 TaxID=3160575 RepID=UPI0038663DD8